MKETELRSKGSGTVTPSARMPDAGASPFVPARDRRRTLLLNTLSRRWVAFAAMLLVALLVISAGALFNASTRNMIASQSTLKSYQDTQSFEILAELLHVNAVLKKGNAGFRHSDRMVEDLSASARKLRRQVDELRDGLDVEIRGLARGGQDQETADFLVAAGRNAIQRIEATIAALDVDQDEMRLISGRIFFLTEDARVAMTLYMHETRQYRDLLSDRVVARMLSLTHSILVVLFIFLLAGCWSIFLLHREAIVQRQREQAERRADFLAYFDPMTRLPNRVQFQDRMAAAIMEEKPATLFLVDIDNFKAINDRMGHAVGDAVLNEVSRRLQGEALRHGGFVARLGGDEFAACLPTEDVKLVADIARTMVELCSRPVSTGGEVVQSGISIGAVAKSRMSRGGTVKSDLVMRAADFALYASKGAGRGRFTIFGDALERQFNSWRAMTGELPDAIAAGDLEVFLQPKVDIASREVYGFEALVRWLRRGDIVSPENFIHIAQKTGMIVDLDCYMLEHATRLIADWNNRHGTAFSVSVNLSVMLLLEGSVKNRVAEALDASGLPPHLLTLEITETVDQDDWDKVRTTLEALRGLGCRIAIDDFGVGHSSLTYLRAVTADELKIDKSFVTDIDNSDQARYIMEAVLDLAATLGLAVVVEGLEREDQFAAVSKLGAQSGQGYLFGRPRPAADWLADVTYKPRPPKGRRTVA